MSIAKLKPSSGNLYSLQGTQIVIKDEFKNFEMIDFFVEARKLPRYLFSGINKIHIGIFPELEENGLVAKLTDDDEIYISSKQKDKKNAVASLTHELGHSVVKRYSSYFLADNTLKNEFLKKRKSLYTKISDNLKFGHTTWKELREKFVVLDYNQTVDELIGRIGPEKLRQYIQNVFVSTYSLTSFDEYIAEGIEIFYSVPSMAPSVKLICPVLYKKITILHKEKAQ
jgi:hypothetical protein